YSVFANLGVKSEPVSILAVVRRDGQLLETRNAKMKRVAPASICYVIDDVLKDVLRYGTAARSSSLGVDRPYAGKSGTTSNYRDAWFIGYSPRVLSLVWVGFDDGHSIRLAGSDACLPIWARHTNRIEALVPDVDWRRPEDVVEREIDPESGMLATPYCTQTRTEIYVAGTEPDAVCPIHAGSGELSPMMQEEHSMDQMTTPAVGDPAIAQKRAEEQKRRAREKENSIRKLLKKI